MVSRPLMSGIQTLSTLPILAWGKRMTITLCRYVSNVTGRGKMHNIINRRKIFGKPWDIAGIPWLWFSSCVLKKTAGILLTLFAEAWRCDEQSKQANTLLAVGGTIRHYKRRRDDTLNRKIFLATVSLILCTTLFIIGFAHLMSIS